MAYDTRLNDRPALHDWIAAFGTVRADAEKLGQGETARAMPVCLDETGAAGERHNEIARTMMWHSPPRPAPRDGAAVPPSRAVLQRDRVTV